ncbi:unnamed protein product [Dicrocoelium dendriticum]|nr:unnamed protein product [Dicrocoelium dendriticum]CAH8507643.1 unnamed protein product [Dicrocoelium dendriticum]CAH8567573.1 unnamed protein product [Dicrocoelium dendriticum]CAI2737536.1 unnamed protein product [Dicrocoelium dendriticum]
MKVSRPDSDDQVCGFRFPLPPFRETNPKAWFNQLESIFSLHGVNSDSVKFHCVVAALPPQVVDDLDDILELPEHQKSYDELKAVVLKRFGISDHARVTQLLNETELGDRKPSQLLHKMQALAKPLAVGDSFLKEMWLRCLPRDMRNPLYANDAPLPQLADIADRIWESNAQISQVQSTSSTEVAELRAQVSALTNRLEKLTQSGSNRRNRPSSRSPPRSRSKSPPRSSYCWYHERFGHQARSCRPPCSFKRNMQGNG